MNNEELHRARLRHFQLYDLAPFGYCNLDEEGRIEEANLTLASLLAVPRTVLREKTLAQFIHKEDRDAFYRHCRNLDPAQPSSSCELRMMRAEVGYFWARISATESCREPGTRALHVTISDCSEQHTAEMVSRRALLQVEAARMELVAAEEKARADAAVSESAALNRAILDSIPVEVAVVNSDGEVIAVNEAWRVAARKNGFAPGHTSGEDGIGINYRVLLSDHRRLPAEVASKADEAIQAVLDGVRSHFHMEYRERSSTKTGWFSMEITPLGADGGGAVVTQADITQRKEFETVRLSHEREQREAHRMQSISTLAGGVAHDFNNMLTIILGNAELASSAASDNIRVRESVEEIAGAARRGRDLIRQILSFSQRQPAAREITPLEPVIKESVQMLRATLPARLVLEVDCRGSVPNVNIDATHMKQLLVNLVTNASQAIGNNPGHIRIALDTVNLLDADFLETEPALGAMQAAGSKRAVRIAVGDDGQGIDEDILGRIFDPFFTTRTVDQGTGLGLSVVHGIVRTHEGVITVRSRPNEGSTFTVYLPPAEASAPEVVVAPAAATNAIHVNGQRILYIDDDEALVLLVTRILNRGGFHATGFLDSEKALDALRAAPDSFDLVVTDYNMPHESGLDVAREVRAIRSGLPVAIATGFIDDTLREQADGAGVCELIFKPDAVEELCERLGQLLQRVGSDHVAK